jgi:hypothetical protein
VVPDFEAETTQGTLKWHEWIDGSWAVSSGSLLDFGVLRTNIQNTSDADSDVQSELK